MASGTKPLIDCRSALAEVRRLAEDVELMAQGMMIYPDDAVMAERKRKCEAALNGARKRLTGQMAMAMQQLDEVPRSERKILYHYYVLGYTMERCAQEAGMDVRSAYKLKRSGMDALSGAAGESRREP